MNAKFSLLVIFAERSYVCNYIICMTVLLRDLCDKETKLVKLFDKVCYLLYKILPKRFGSVLN